MQEVSLVQLFAISVYNKGYLRNFFYHQKMQIGMNMAILANSISGYTNK